MAGMVPGAGRSGCRLRRADLDPYPDQGPLLAAAPGNRSQRAPAQGAQSAAGRRSRGIRGRHEHPQVHEPDQDQPRDGLPGAYRPGQEGLSATYRKGRKEQRIRDRVVATPKGFRANSIYRIKRPPPTRPAESHAATAFRAGPAPPGRCPDPPASG